jgi:hypothetical protein
MNNIDGLHSYYFRNDPGPRGGGGTSFPAVAELINFFREFLLNIGAGLLMPEIINTLLCIVLAQCSEELTEPRNKEEE